MTFFIEKPSKILQWLNAKGYSGTVEDAFITYVQSGSPLTSGTMEDHLRARLNASGYSGTMDDMLTTMFQAATGVQNRHDAERQFFQDATKDMFSASIGGIDAYTKLMLHFDNNVTDSELTPKTVTNNSVTFDNSVYKFGGYSAQFNGTTGYLSVPDSADWCFEAGDFTIDFWFNSNAAISSDQYLVMQGASGDYWLVYINSASKMQYASTYASIGNGGGFIATNAFTFTPGTWYHLAWVKNGANMLMFIAGVGQAVTTTSPFAPASLTDFGTALNIGAFNGSGFANCKIDELRISKGIARWTSDFTPPASAYTT